MPDDEFPDEKTNHDLDPADEELVKSEPEAPVEEAEVLAHEFPDEEPTLSGGAPQIAEIQREHHLQSIIESLLFVADKPLSLQHLGQVLGESDLGPVRAAVAAIE